MSGEDLADDVLAFKLVGIYDFEGSGTMRARALFRPEARVKDVVMWRGAEVWLCKGDVLSIPMQLRTPAGDAIAGKPLVLVIDDVLRDAVLLHVEYLEERSGAVRSDSSSVPIGGCVSMPTNGPISAGIGYTLVQSIGGRP